MKILYAAGLSPNDSIALPPLGAGAAWPHRHPSQYLSYYPPKSSRPQGRPSPLRRSLGLPPQPRLLESAAARSPTSSGPTSSSRCSPAPSTAFARMGIAHRQLHDRQPLRPPARPRLAPLHERHSALRSPRRATRQEHHSTTAAGALATSSRSRPPTSPPFTSRRPPAGPTPTATAKSPSSVRPTTTAPHPRPALARLGEFQVAISGSAGLAAAPDPATFCPPLSRRRALPAAVPRRHLALEDQSQLPHPLQSGRVRPQELRDRRLRRLPSRRALPGPSRRFVEDEEAVFFSWFENAPTRSGAILPDEAARQRIAAAGRLRAARDGYHNDRQVERILDRISALRSTPASALASGN